MSATDPRLAAWLRGWRDGATGKPGRMPRLHDDEYERGYVIGQQRAAEAYAVAATRLRGTAIPVRVGRAS